MGTVRQGQGESKPLRAKSISVVQFAVRAKHSSAFPKYKYMGSKIWPRQLL